MSSNFDLSAAIRSFAAGYSIEASPYDSDKLGELVDVLKPGTSVYVAHLPGMPLDEVIDFAGRVRSLGFKPVPHIVSRKLTSREQLAEGLARLQQLDIDQALVIGGDQPVDDNVFDSSLEVLRTGLFEKYGFRNVGVAGHPEGSKSIGDAIAEQALIDKSQFAKTAAFKVYIATQFGFDPVAVTEWEARTSAQGVDLPIHIGVAGPASLRQLVRFAMKCGVGASARMLMTRTGATANLLRTQAPDDLITHFARHRNEESSSRLAKLHFFAFGGIVKTARWANAVVDGKFELNSKETGFSVQS